MSVKGFLQELKEKQISIGIRHDQLLIESSGDHLTEEIVASIESRKGEIFAHMSKQKTIIIQTSQKKEEWMEKQRDTFPMSFAQKRLWLIEQIDSTSGAYNMNFRFALFQIDINLFEEVINTLVQRHEILRTTFLVENGDPVQKINAFSDTGFKVEYIDLRNSPNLREAYQAIVRESEEHRFDLEEGPLLQVKLIQLKEEEFRVLFDIHHIIFDGWSIDLFKAEFSQLYEEGAQGNPLELPKLTYQYKDYTLWQIDQHNSGAWDEKKDFWHKQFEDEIPKLGLMEQQLKLLDGEVQSLSIQFTLDEDTLQKLKSTCFAQNSTVYMGLLTLTYLILYKHTQQTDLIIGVPIAGRTKMEFEKQLGFYVNTLPLRLRFSESDTFNTLLCKVRNLTLLSFEHQEYPFDLLVEELDLQRSIVENPLFDVMVVHETSDMPLDVDGELETLPIDSSKFDLEICYSERTDGMIVQLNYTVPTFSDNKMKRLVSRFETVIQEVIRNPDGSVREVPFMPDTEKVLLDQYISGRAREYRVQTLPDLVDDQCNRSPEAIAITCNGTQLTYAQLKEHSDLLAQILIDRYNIKKGDLIGVMVSRDERLPIVLLGILKAGAAYVPLDPEYPVFRIEFMIADSRMPLLMLDDQVAKIPEFDNISTLCNLINIDSINFQEKPENKIKAVVSPDDKAYIIYTSRHYRQTQRSIPISCKCLCTGKLG